MTSIVEHPAWIARYIPKDACTEGIQFASWYDTENEFWLACPRGDWMLWYVRKKSGLPGSDARRRLTLCSCECARLCLPFAAKGEDCSRLAIEAAESWGRREHDYIDKVVSAAEEVRAVATELYSAKLAKWSAEYVAACVAYAAASAAYSEADASCAENAAGVDMLTGPVHLARCAEIVRKHYPGFPM